MRLVVRQRIFSFGDSFTVKDEMGNDRYEVRGKVFSMGDKLKIFDMTGNEAVYIEQKLFKFLPEYNIYLYGRPAATVKKKFTLLGHRFEIESTMGRYSVDGNFWGHEFNMLKDGRIAAVISKKYFSLSDTYGIDIAEGENVPFILALAIVIDQIIYDDNNH